MNSRLLLAIVPLAGLLITTGCNKSEPPATPPAKPVAVAAPVVPPPVEEPLPPTPAGPSLTEKKSVEKMRAMEVEQAELQQQLEEEKFARLEAEMAAEQALLDRERATWSAEQGSQVAQIPVSEPAVHIALGPTDTYDSSDYQTFYDDLAPYGTWYDSLDYGYCWQPSVCISDVSWRPYTRGCWNSCNAGWAWCSDEPFGWACYHYGRWVRCKNRGWLWCPGSQWAPAWVCWRKNDNYVGWCPLPPETVYDNNCTWGPTVDSDCGIDPSCYVFVPCKHFDRPVLGYCEAPSVCLRICGSTVNCTNIICRPGHVQCNGPDYDWITRSVRRNVPKYNLAFDSSREARKGPAHKVEKDRLRFYAPKVERPWNQALRPRTNVSRLEKVEFVRAASGVPDKLTSRFKTERSAREKALATQDNKAVRKIIDRQQKLTEMQKNREAIAADVHRRSETIQKNRLADGPQRPEAPVAKAPRAAAVTPQQNGGDVSPPVVPDRTQPGRSRVGNDVARQPRENGKAGNVPETNSQATAAAERAAALEAARREAAAREVAAREVAARETAVRETVNDAKRQSATTREADNGRNGRAAQLEEQRRRTEEAAAAADVQDRQAAAIEAQRRQAAETAARNESATQELERQRTARAQQMDEKRRQDQADAVARAQAQTAALQERQRQLEAQRAAVAEQRQAAASRAAAEQQNQEESARTAAVRERSRQQESARSAAIAEQQRAAAAADAEARAEQSARQREELERQRAAMEQQRRQAEAQAQAAREESARREAQERQQAMEQRRQQQEEQQRRQQEEHASRQREAAAQQQEQQRQAEQQRQESARHQAEENSRREASERARQDNDHKRGR